MKKLKQILVLLAVACVFFACKTADTKHPKPANQEPPTLQTAPIRYKS